MKTDGEPEPHSIAVLQLGRLGDSILTTPLYAGLKRIYPDSRITVIAYEASAIVARHSPGVDDVIALPVGFLRLPTLAVNLLTHRYDLYIDPKDHRSTTSKVIAEVVRAKRLLIDRTNLPRLSSGEAIAPPAGPHFVDKVLAPLANLSPGQAFPRRPSIIIPTEAIKAVERRMQPGSSGAIVFNISAGHSSRYWREENWRELAKRTAGHRPVIVISGPRDRALGERIVEGVPNATYVPTDSILEAAAMLAGASAVVSPDTSIVHLASALNLPTIGLYPPIPWNTTTFAPLATRCTVLTPPDGENVEAIGVDEVWEAICNAEFGLRNSE